MLAINHELVEGSVMLSILTDAQDLIRDKANWIKRDFAVDKYRSPAFLVNKAEGGYAFSRVPVAWCAHGAMSQSCMDLEQVRTDSGEQAFIYLRNSVRELTSAKGIMELNDWQGTEHSTIMNVFDKAIEAVELDFNLERESCGQSN